MFLEPFVSREIKERFKGDAMKGISVLRLFQGYFKEVQWMFQGSFKGVARKFQGRFKKE